LSQTLALRMTSFIDESRIDDTHIEDTCAEATVPAPAGRNWLSPLRVLLLLLALLLISQFFVVVPVGARGVLLRFGAVQESALEEGLHPLLPGVESVHPLSVRVQTLTLRSQAASRDLQDVTAEVTLSWHLRPERVAAIYRMLGEESAIVQSVIRPALDDGVQAVVARLTAEELITERAVLKRGLVENLSVRLHANDLELDAVDLVQLEFSRRFRQAVEAKQVAEQDARRAQYEALKAQRLAQARVHAAEGEARAQQLLQAGLTPELLEHQRIEKWNGRLPLVVSRDGMRGLNLKALLKAERMVED
jgi:regulator of protease activity HflC (stomatin/prohibitin superfamily)